LNVGSILWKGARLIINQLINRLPSFLLMLSYMLQKPLLRPEMVKSYTGNPNQGLLGSPTCICSTEDTDGKNRVLEHAVEQLRNDSELNEEDSIYTTVIFGVVRDLCVFPKDDFSTSGDHA